MFIPQYSNSPGLSTLLNKAQSKIIIYSFSANEMMFFPAFVTDFSDAFTSNWNITDVYGKMDPIATFKNTVRVINLSFDLPSYDTIDAENNNKYLDKLISGLYPIYSENTGLGTNIMTSPPLFRIKFSNLIQNNGIEQAKSQDINSVDNVNKDPTLIQGLLGFFKSFDYKPDFSQGVLEIENKIFPKLVKVSLSYNVIHEHALGNKISGNEKINRNTANGYVNFPHGFNIREEPHIKEIRKKVEADKKAAQIQEEKTRKELEAKEAENTTQALLRLREVKDAEREKFDNPKGRYARGAADVIEDI